MLRLFQVVLFALVLVSCGGEAQAHGATEQPQRGEVLVGATDTAQYMPLLRGKRVAVLANHTAMFSSEEHIVDMMHREGVQLAGIFAPGAVELVGFLMLGNLIRECGVLNNLSQTAQKELANLVTIVLGISISFSLQAKDFLQFNTLLIMALGLAAFVFDTFGGIMFAKFLNIFSKKKINPMIGAAGISAFPMSGRIVHKMGLAEDPQNFLLMHSIGVNVSGQIASVIAGGLILNFFM